MKKRKRRKRCKSFYLKVFRHCLRLLRLLRLFFKALNYYVIRFNTIAIRQGYLYVIDDRQL
jgi:hypothetical protein